MCFEEYLFKNKFIFKINFILKFYTKIILVFKINKKEY